MMKVKARKEKFKIVRCSNEEKMIFPYVKDVNGSLTMELVSPTHGRSFVLGRERNGRYVIGKGNGLSYSTYDFLINSQDDSDTWGGLSLESAIRDFEIGKEISKLGIKTNIMDYVLELPFNTIFRGKISKAALLQYSIECPYRLNDYGFISQELLRQYVSLWETENTYHQKHLIAADILFGNLKLLHENGILHNAINIQNYTWALELVDFEASHTPQMPFGSSEYQSFIPMLTEMEILQTYEIVNYIAWCLKEEPNYHETQEIIQSYKFDLRPF